MNSIRLTNRSFDWCNSCKRLVPSRLQELHESKLLFVYRIEFIRSKLSKFSAHASGVTNQAGGVALARGDGRRCSAAVYRHQRWMAKISHRRRRAAAAAATAAPARAARTLTACSCWPPPATNRSWSRAGAGAGAGPQPTPG